MSTLQVGTISEKVTDAGVAVDGVTLKDGDVTIADKIIHDGDTNTAIRFPSADTVTIETGGSESFRVDANGHVTMPSQSAFLVTKSGTQSNIAVNGATTVTFETEVFDQNGDFASHTFTAPVTGKYQLNGHFYLLNVDTGATLYEVNILTSNRNYSFDLDPNFSADVSYFGFTISALADMDASDTAYMRVYQSGGTQQTDISSITKFSGYLVC